MVDISSQRSVAAGGGALLVKAANRSEVAKRALLADHAKVVLEPAADPVRKLPLKRSATSSALLECIKKMGAGEHPALAQCYDQMGPIVFSLAVRMLRDRQAAEDVTQDIFVQVWRQAGHFDTSRGSGEAWVMMIARTRILDRLRSRSAGIVLTTLGEHLPDSVDAEDWPDDLAMGRENAANVREALGGLPADQKEAISLAFFDGLTHVEIANRLGVPLGTIKTRIRLGLIKMKERIRGQDTLEDDNLSAKENGR